MSLRAVLLVSCLLALAGCGGNEGGPATTPPRSTQPARQAPRVVHRNVFRSPTGNIGCAITADAARCDIRDRSWSPPPKPPSCQFDWGDSLNVGQSGTGRLGCISDSALNPAAQPLAYRTASRVGRFACYSAVDGMRCVNLDTEHGFVLSRARYRTF